MADTNTAPAALTPAARIATVRAFLATKRNGTRASTIAYRTGLTERQVAKALSSLRADFAARMETVYVCGHRTCVWSLTR